MTLVLYNLSKYSGEAEITAAMRAYARSPGAARPADGRTKERKKEGRRLGP